MMIEKLGFPEERDFAEGMSAKYKDGKLVWIEEGQWIRVDDLPVEFVAELMQLPCYAATAMCEAYLNDQ